MPLLNATVSIAPTGTVTSTSGQARPVVNVFSYQVVGINFHAGWPGAFVTAFETQVWSFIAALLHTDYVGVRYDLYLDPQLRLPPTFTGAMTVNGGVAGAREPISSCINFLALTGVRGKSFRGIKRIGPVASSQVVKDELTAGALAAWQAAAANLLVNLNLGGGDTFSPVVLSRQLSSFTGPPVYVGAPLTSVVVNKTLGVARHRRERTQR